MGHQCAPIDTDIGHPTPMLVTNVASPAARVCEAHRLWPAHRVAGERGGV